MSRVQVLLSDKIRGILRAAATAEAPLTAGEIRERLVAMGVENVEDIYKRLSHLVHRGEVATTDQARGKRYWMSDRFTPAPAAKRHKRPDGVPSLTQRVLDIVTARPGVMFAEVRDMLVAQGVELREGQPSTCLSRLHDRGQLRSEGKLHVRRYFIGDLEARPASKAKKPAPSSEGVIRAHLNRQAAVADTVDEGTLPAATRPLSDDPIDRLADAIQQHLELSEPWITSTLIAEDLDEDPIDVARALRRLVDAKRANVRTIAGVREYAVGVDWEPEAAPAPAPAATSIETGPLSDSNGPISTDSASKPPSFPEIKPGSAPDAAEGATVAPLPDVDDPTTPFDPAVLMQRAVYRPAEVRFVPDFEAHAAAQTPAQNARIGVMRDLLDISDAALSEAPLIQSAQFLRGDIEDLVGRACDRRADHHAIKALTTAAFALSRAIQHLHTAG